MIIMPPDKLLEYILLDNNGDLTHKKDMPKELIPIFDSFVETMSSGRNDRINIFKEAKGNFNVVK